MPYEIRKEKDGWGIYKKDTGKKVGHSSTKEKAEASVRAREAGEHNHSWWKRKG